MKDKKIIVIDDMEGLRKLTIKMLKTIGFQNVIEAEDGVH
jgi:FixJ family two-component response regulator